MPAEPNLVAARTVQSPLDTAVASRNVSLGRWQSMFPGSHLAVFSVFAAIAFAVISDGVALAQNNKPQSSVSRSTAPQRQSKAGGAAADVARGKYLVEDVAVCGQCHTPR